MATTIKQTEEMIPADYPSLPEGFLNASAAALDPVFIWQRIESYCAHRWSTRDVEWLVEGVGQWIPPLSPTNITKAEIWQGEEWQEIVLRLAPFGGIYLSRDGYYRFTATVGDTDAVIPPAVLEAFKRLAEYSAQSKGKAGARSETISAGSINLSHTRSPTWMADALRLSGAADLLRPYRMA